MVEEQGVEVRWGGGIRKGWELVGVPSLREPLGCPYRFGINPGEKSLPVFSLGLLYGLEVSVAVGSGLG